MAGMITREEPWRAVGEFIELRFRPLKEIHGLLQGPLQLLPVHRQHVAICLL